MKVQVKKILSIIPDIHKISKIIITSDLIIYVNTTFKENIIEKIIL